VTMLPPVPLLACAGILVAALPAVLAPPLPVVRPGATQETPTLEAAA
jgi:energy-coupling factor transport system permease protein